MFLKKVRLSAEAAVVSGLGLSRESASQLAAQLSPCVAVPRLRKCPHTKRVTVKEEVQTEPTMKAGRL